MYHLINRYDRDYNVQSASGALPLGQECPTSQISQNLQNNRFDGDMVMMMMIMVNGGHGDGNEHGSYLHLSFFAQDRDRSGHSKGFRLHQVGEIQKWRIHLYNSFGRCCNGPIQYKDFKAVKEDTRILTKVGIGC